MIAVTGATGQLGRLVIANLLIRGGDASKIAAVVRDSKKAADLFEADVAIRRGDYTDPDSLEVSLEGVERLLLISSSEVGRRVAHHRNVIEAAVKAGVKFLVYTSILRAASSPMKLAAEHRETEDLIRNAGIPFAFLRNGWYTENYTDYLGQVIDSGMLIGSASDGRISAATRSDYAAAAAAVLVGEGHDGAVFELGGDDAFTMDELAQEISRQGGMRVVYRNLPEGRYEEGLVESGLPEPFAAVLADSSRAIADGHLFVDAGDLRRLIGRPTTTLAEAVADALAEQEAAVSD